MGKHTAELSLSPAPSRSLFLFDTLDKNDCRAILSFVDDTSADPALTSRAYFEGRILPFVDKPLVKVVTGIRRAGKSSVLRLVANSILAGGVKPQRILFINMESMVNDAFRDPAELHRFVRARKEKANDRLFLFIDEIQEIPGWERAVNSFLADGDADIFISGSNSKLLSGELASLLSGRYVEFPVFTLSFAEYRDFRKSDADAPTLFSEYLRFGGFPGIHRMELEEDTIQQYLSALVDSVLLKDVVMRYGVRDVALLRALLLFLADNSGNVFSARSVATFLKKERRSLGVETIYNYLEYLESAFVVHRVPRWDIKGKRLLETHEKYYLADIGLRHAFLGYRDRDIGGYLENIVFLELRKRNFEVRIGKLGDYEVDFVASRGAERLYIQVAYLLGDEATREREFRPLRAVRDNHPKYVLSLDRLPPGNEDGIQRLYLPDFLDADW